MTKVRGDLPAEMVTITISFIRGHHVWVYPVQWPWVSQVESLQLSETEHTQERTGTSSHQPGNTTSSQVVVNSSTTNTSVHSSLKQNVSLDTILMLMSVLGSSYTWL